MKQCYRILRKFFDKKTLEMYRLINQKKYGVGDLALNDVENKIGCEYIIIARATPETKIYFCDNIYLFAYSKNNEQKFQVGVDPDKNKFLVPYEE